MWWVLPVIIVSVVVFSVIIVLAIVFISSYAEDKTKKNNNYIPLSVRSSDFAGEWGETLANFHLRPLIRSDEYLLNNLLIPLSNGHNTEIDCVMITRRGLFCIETKRWSGHIEGADNDEDWIQKYDDKRRANKLHKNPVKQNENHCDILARFLDYKYNVDNIVLFINLEDGSGINSEYVFTPRQFKHYYNELDDELNINDIEAIRNRLVGCIAGKEQLEEHKRDIQRRYGEYN